MVSGPLELLDNNVINGHRKLFYPFPSEVVVPPAAYKAAGGNSDLNVFLVVIFATIGVNIGAIINYYIALFRRPSAGL